MIVPLLFLEVVGRTNHFDPLREAEIFGAHGSTVRNMRSQPLHRRPTVRVGECSDGCPDRIHKPGVAPQLVLRLATGLLYRGALRSRLLEEVGMDERGAGALEGLRCLGLSKPDDQLSLCHKTNDERREIRVAGYDGKRVDVFRQREFDRVNGQRNICRILLLRIGELLDRLNGEWLELFLPTA